MVIIIIKKNKFDKAHMPNWSSEKYEVFGIDNNNSVKPYCKAESLYDA